MCLSGRKSQRRQSRSCSHHSFHTTCQYNDDMLRHTSAFVLAWFISCTPIGAQTNGVPRGKVMGHVFCSDSHTPCRFAGVTIQSVPLAAAGNKANHPSLSYSAATDMDGAFVISNVASGEYYVQARSPGYLSPTDLVASEVDPNSTLYSK